MSYEPIPLESAADSIKRLVSQRIEPILRDVHRMLELERRTSDDPAFNFSVVGGLFGVIGGLSRVFFSATKDDSKAFPAASLRYPLQLEPAGAGSNLEREFFAEELYKVYRCNLVHSLGLTLEWSTNLGRWEVVTKGIRRKVTRHEPLPLNAAQLAELNDTAIRPQWLESTLSTRDGVVRLNAEALYWGVRWLARDLANDASLRAAAVEFLRPWYEADILQDFAVLSSADPEVAVFGGVYGAVDATAGAQSSLQPNPRRNTSVNSG